MSSGHSKLALQHIEAHFGYLEDIRCCVRRYASVNDERRLYLMLKILHSSSISVF